MPQAPEQCLCAWIEASLTTHSSAYSYFLEDCKERVQDGFGGTLGKGLRMIKVQGNKKYGPLVTCDESGFHIMEGWFKLERQGEPGSRFFHSVNLSDEPRAECV